MLLQRGAARVVGIDVGRGQLHPRLAADPRVSAFEGLNVRELAASAAFAAAAPADGFDVVVADLSFISLTHALPVVARRLGEHGDALLLVKPQFELQPADIGKGGLVKDAAAYPRVETRIREACAALQLQVRDYFASAIAGGDGNREFFVLGARHDAERRHDARHAPVPISFEFFPPNTPVGDEKLKGVVQELGALKPEFFSVTYGAGGSTRDKTLATVSAIADAGFEAAPHLSCVGATAKACAAILATYRAQGIRRLVALRGDLPSGYGDGGRLPLRERAGRLHPRGDRRLVPHRGRRLPRVPPAAALRDARPEALRRQGQRRRELGDHAVLLQPRRLLPLRRRDAQARRHCADRAGHHAVPQLSEDHPFAAAAAPRSRAGSR